MSTIPTGAITKNDALQQVKNWAHYCENLTLVKQLFNKSGSSFLINPDFQADNFEDTGHAYFGVHTTEIEGGGLKLQLNLLIIPEEQDTSDNETPYIYCAPYFNTGDISNNKPGDENLVALREEWLSNGVSWLEGMVPSEEGMTLVSDVPVADLTTVFDFEHELFVFFGLRSMEDPHEELSLLFFDGDSQDFVHLPGADFTTPKPPFGTDLAKYSLLESAEA